MKSMLTGAIEIKSSGVVFDDWRAGNWIVGSNDVGLDNVMPSFCIPLDPAWTFPVPADGPADVFDTAHMYLSNNGWLEEKFNANNPTNYTSMNHSVN